MTLPARLRSDQNGDVAIGIEPHLRGFLAHGAANLDIGAKTDAAHQTLLLRGLGAFWKFLPLGNVHRALHVRREITGVVDLAGGGRVRHRARRNEVLAPDRIRRHAELARGGIDQTLDHIGRLGPPGTAIGIHRNRVGEDRADAAMESLKT